MAAGMPDVGCLCEDLEGPWAAFLGSFLAETVRNCLWISSAFSRAGEAILQSRADAAKRRLVNSAVSWNWVFGRPRSVITFRQVCDELGYDEQFVRERILSACGSPPDINHLVARVLAERLEACGDWAQRPEAKVVVVDWASITKKGQL